MLHYLNSIYPVRYTTLGLCVLGLLLSVFALVGFGVGEPLALLFAALLCATTPSLGTCASY